MMQIKKLGTLLVGLVGLGGCLITFAATTQTAKEDTTPPAAEGALTVDQIPPISSIRSNAAPQPSAPAATPGTGDSTTTTPTS